MSTSKLHKQNPLMMEKVVNAMDYPIFVIKKQIRDSLSDALADLGYQWNIKIEIPPPNMGDFAFPCFDLTSIFKKKSPPEIAKIIISNLKENKWFEKVVPIGGYINFFINSTLLSQKTLYLILKMKNNYGNLPIKNKKVIIEHTSVNPNGPLHVGRARNPIIGDTLVRIFRVAGYSVESQFYVDDLGKQVAILAWGVNNLQPPRLLSEKKEKPDHYYVTFYQEANKRMEEDERVAQEITEIVKKSEKGNKTTLQNIHSIYSPVLKGIEESLNRINISIDTYVPESKFVKNKDVEQVIEKLKKNLLCKEENGALYLDLISYGIKGRNTKFFFLRRDGTSLYATRDIAYHLWKAKHADILVNILGEDHKLESKQVEIALNLLGEISIPIPVFYAFVSLPEGKMSTRRGRVIYLDDLIDESLERSLKEIKKRRGNELSKDKMKKISQILGVGALRYNIIKVQPEKDIVFKWEEALNLEGNSSPFIQYAYARACSILSKKKIEISYPDSTLLTHISEQQLLKKLAYFPHVVEDACKGYKPHLVAMYLFELASMFNQFYRDCPVLSCQNPELQKGRISLVEATKIVLNKGLNILGIGAPEEM